jgi:hypothetical protein
LLFEYLPAGSFPPNFGPAATRFVATFCAVWISETSIWSCSFERTLK